MKKILSLFVSTCLALSLIGCEITVKQKQTLQEIPPSPIVENQDSFVFLKKNVAVRACRSEGSQVICVSNQKSASASGVVVGHSLEKRFSYVLTAQHVCESYEPEVDEKEYIEGQIEVNNFIGERVLSEIVAVDVDNDLCLLKTPYIEQPAVKMSPNPPIKGEKLYNVAAPLGVWHKDMQLNFEGKFQGSTDQTLGEGMTMNNTAYYTIPGNHGSSGSPVYNAEGELVGIIVAIVLGGSVTMGPRWDKVNDFLLANLPNQSVETLTSVAD